MSIALTLLAGVRWRGIPVAGERPQALLAALAARECRPVGPAALIELVWGDEAPGNAAKSLQVLVSRVRSACGADAIVTDGAGYRLGAAPAEVDSVRLSGLVRQAGAALDGDAVRAAELAREALAVADGLVRVTDGESGPLAEVRRDAADDTAAARVILARASSRTGAHADALAELELAAVSAATAGSPQDEALLADLLRSEAAVRGPAVALERFERYRRELRDRLGTDPGEQLQHAHRSLLALDRPVRRGVRYDATELIGRDRDLDRLRALLASARVVSIIGAGGLGKTRLAHVLAREATQPVVHFVELAGVTSAEDVAVEVGSVLGVRDSVSGRRTLTAQQRADIRARIAQRLGQAPGLLVLDNCEHLIEAAAELTAFLIAATPDLRILTTSRAPLAIAAERVYPLGELGPADAIELFRERAVAARPGARLPDEVVASIVGRLDGLPLAIELAAAKVRVMSAEEIDRRLEDRFALLRGGDRSAPDRHRALLTVIEWSWNLLAEAEQRALRRLSLFHDGFTLEAAEEVLGPGAVDAVDGLVDQSLLAVRETPASVRYRMLETVREFGWLQLAQSGDETAARAALRRWAVGYVAGQQPLIMSPAQFAAVDALAAEETNLADELRAAMADGDRDSLVQLLALLSVFWTIRGEHVRVLVLSEALLVALRDWEPPPELAGVTRAAVGVTANTALMTGAANTGALLALLRRLGPGDGGNPYVAGLVEVLLAVDVADPVGSAERVQRLADDADRGLADGDRRLADGDRLLAVAASQWLSHEYENSGDPAGAYTASARALSLTRDEDGPWARAMAHSQLAELAVHLGDWGAAVEHARAALPVMRRLGAGDDEIQLQAALVMAAVAEGRLADAAVELDRVERINEGTTTFGGLAFRRMCRAELLLAAGDVADGLAIYRESAERMREFEFPGVARTGMEPWALFGDSMALAAHAQYASGDDELAEGQALFALCRDGALKVLGQERPNLDYPASGLLLFALGAWGLLRQAGPAEDALRLLALAHRFAYSRANPTMSWERIVGPAQDAVPGMLAELVARYRERPLPDLQTEARQAVERLFR